VEWFRNTPDGVLMSVGVFTTGFSEDDVECIILNKSTKSLSLYHQMVGRGGRITNTIFKPYFKLIDLGGNVKEFGSWSENVDWAELYKNEVEKKCQVRDLEDFIVCYNCSALINSYDCPVCGAKKKEKKASSKVVIAEEITKLPPPKANHILKYSISNNLDVNEAKTLTANYLVDMLIFAKTSKETVYKDLNYLNKKIDNLIRPIYFSLHGSDLEGNRKRTLKDFRDKVLKRIDSYYKV